MAEVDRHRLRSAFHRQAAEYDRHAELQREVVRRFLAELPELPADPGRILDIGCGTGQLLSGLQQRFPSAGLVGLDLAEGMCRQTRARLAGRGHFVSADAEHLPLRTASCQLVVSTSTLQWLPDFGPVAAEVRRVLSPGGLFAASLFVAGTLAELQASYRDALRQVASTQPDRTHRFLAAADVRAALCTAGFRDVQVRESELVSWHGDVPDLLRSLRGIGAGNAAATGPRSLGERRVMQTMMALYRQRFATAAGLPATYRVLSLIAWR